MRNATFCTALTAITLLGCNGGAVALDPAPRPDTGPTDDTDVVIDCGLAISPTMSSVLPRDDIRFEAFGGSGEYTFAIQDNASGGLISPTSGAYLAGGETGGTDTIVVTDAACPDSAASAEVVVFTPLTVSPTDTWLTPGTGVIFDVQGGSGDIRCELATNISTGRLDGCGYVAGRVAGIDVVNVVDQVTGQIVEATFHVDPNAELSAPTTRFVVGTGAALPLEVRGGSGDYDVRVMSGPGSIDEQGQYRSLDEGRSQVFVQDVYTQMTLSLRVDAIAARVPSTVVPDGDMTITQRVRGPGDLNGDGYDDVILLNSEAGVEARLGGAVEVYAGGPDGLSETPVFSEYGTQVSENMGRRAATGDFDGDGQLDLVLGSQDRKDGLPAAGWVAVFPGIAGGFFADAPSVDWEGERSFDRLGHGVAACDFDGDGYDDLAVSAYAAEDEAQDPDPVNQGSVYIHMGGPVGVQPEWDQQLWGVSPDGLGGFSHHANMLLGRTLTSGDLNGDGRCDLLVSSHDRGLVTSGSPGAVFVYLGSDTGVSTEPDRIFAVIDGDTAANFGRVVSTGDVDGDGKDEVLIGAWRRRLNGSTNWGEASLFRGDAYSPDEALVFDSLDADWFIQGNQRYDYMGYGVDLADIDGNGLADVLVGAPIDERPGQPVSTGVVRMFLDTSVSERWGDFTAVEPDAWLQGPHANSWYGQSVASLGDVNGDGLSDVGVIAGRDNTFGPGVGGLYITEWDSGSTGTGMALPMDVSGDLVGRTGTAGWTDVTGEGTPTLIVGAPYSSGGVAPLRGSVGAFLPGPGGTIELVDDGEVVTRPYHGTYDRDGWAVSGGSDMDGDGLQDLLVASYTESRSGNLTAAFSDRSPCTGSRGTAGAVWVYSGQPDGSFTTDPTRVQWGARPGGYVERMEAGFDHNGDGYDDAIMASNRFDSNRGGFSMMYGGPRASSGVIQVGCDDVGVVHSSTSPLFGYAVAGAGDLNGDGCDEVLVSAMYDDFSVRDGGSVRIFWGYGGRSCPSTRQMSTVHSTDASGRFGQSVTGGVDVTGDGVPDVVVGGYRMRLDGTLRGAAVLLSGAELNGLPRQAVGPVMPTTDVTLSAELSTLNPQYIWGPGDFAFFGETVALMSGNRIAVGAPRDAYAGVDGVGVVRIYEVVGGVPRSDPWAIAIGDVEAPGTLFGGDLSATETRSGPALAVGAIYDDGVSIDEGGVFPIFLD
ncbi:MAG: FG-GAP-like repeat-containing protein [Myxococcota bacterium]